MKKKLISILLCVALCAGMVTSLVAVLSNTVFAETTNVTWNQSDIVQGEGDTETSFTKDGVTITCGEIDYEEANFSNDGTFTAPAGKKFTNILINAADGIVYVGGDGWWTDFSSATWSGDPSDSVSFTGDIEAWGCGITFNFTLEASAPSVTEAPKAIENLTANGEAQELVTAGTAENGTMNYALGTDAVTAPTTGWSTTVPSATNAGTYYVWYKAVGNDSSSSSEPACVTATIAKAADTTTVTWNKSDIVKGEGDTETSFTKDGVTLNANEINYNNAFISNANSFTAPEGTKFTKIEIKAKGSEGLLSISGNDWSKDDKYLNAVWSGTPSNSVSLGGSIYGQYADTLTFTFTIEPATTYTVTCSETQNGTVTADPTTAAEGTEVTLTATPDAGYELDAWTVKDANNNDVTVTDNKFTMPASDVTVSATFKATPITTITFDADGPVYDGNQTAVSVIIENKHKYGPYINSIGTSYGYTTDDENYGDLTVKPSTGTTIAKVAFIFYDGSSIASKEDEVSPFTLYMFGGMSSLNSDYSDAVLGSYLVKIEVYGTVATTYTVTCSETQNGTVTADPTTAAEGTEVTLTATPDAGYEFDAWTVKDANNNDVTVTDNKFTMPASDVTVSASFTPVHTHIWSTTWTQTATAHYHECTVDGCPINYNAMTDAEKIASSYGEHDYGDDNTQTAYYICSVCDYEDATREATYHTAVFNNYKTEMATAAGNLAQEGDSDTVKNLISTAQAKINALSYDNTKTLDENKAAVDAICNQLVADLADQRAADAVMQKIDAIGTVEYTTDCKARIDAARAAYDALTDVQKAKVTNYATLTAAEAKYAELEKREKSAFSQGDEITATLPTGRFFPIVTVSNPVKSSYFAFYYSSNARVAAANPFTGQVIAYGRGTAVITAVYMDDSGFHTASYTLTVK